MAIDLTEQDVASHRMLVGDDNFELAAGEKVDVRKKVGGELVDVLPTQTVPAGKSWTVSVFVRITETDA
jgi:hypothetical protein